MSQSEIARIRQQIEAETIAMQQGLNGTAIVGNHSTINKRYQAIGQYHQELITLIGPEKAAQTLLDAYTAGIEGKETR